jgi:hypothetical protein
VIRTVALGVVRLAGLGAIAAAAKKPPPQPAEVVFPMVAGNKADRLPLIPRGESQTEIEKVDVVYVPPVENVTPSSQSAPQKAADPPPPRIISRRWHDPHDLKFFERKQKANSSKPPKKDYTDRAPTPKQVSVKECRSDGLDPLLRKLNLSPQCA